MDKKVDRRKFDVPLTTLNIESFPQGNLEEDLGQIIKKLNESKKGAMALIEDDIVQGVISESDFINKVSFEEKDWVKEPCYSIATLEPHTLREDALISDAIKLLVKKNFRHIPLVDENNKFKSFLSIKDLLAYIIKFFPDQVEEYGTKTSWDFKIVDHLAGKLSSNSKKDNFISGNIFLSNLKRLSYQKPLIMDVDDFLWDAVNLMQRRKRGAIVLTEYETKIKGIFTERDLLFKVLGKINNNEKYKIRDFMTKNPHTLLGKHYVAHALNNMFHFNYRTTVIVNEDRFPLSIIGLLDIFKFVAYDFFDDEISIR